MMFRFTFLLLFCFLGIAALSGCGGGRVSGLTPMPEAVPDPSDAALMEAVRGYVVQQNAPANSRFVYTRVDLNGDGLREGLVLFTAPHTHWCGWGGCSMAVFRARDEGFGFVSEMQRVRGPLIVAESRSNGWRDIIVRVSGTNVPDRNVVMAFDGQVYPSNPLTRTGIPESLAHQDIAGVRVFP